MKKMLLFLSIFIIVTMACDMSVSMAPSTDAPDPQSKDTAVLVTAIPGETSTSPLPSTNGSQVSYGSLSLVLPSGLASGISGTDFPRVEGEDHPYWELTPGHTVVKLEGYFLQGKFHQPQIYVYPAMAYVDMFPGAFESMHRLRNVINPSAPITADQLPVVPFFNAGQLFASNIQAISFQNGSGIRFLTEYGQYPAPVNNNELFYHFQGFTSDGEYYIVAILPITALGLSDSSDPAAAIAIGGVAYPNMGDTNANWEGYYGAATNLLDTTAPDDFTPSISQLDALIQSLLVTP